MSKSAVSHRLASIRLFVDADLDVGAAVAASEGQAHYLLHVMRVAAGAAVLLFNGRDGEWQAEVIIEGKRRVAFKATHRTREQTREPDLWVAFAPVKRVEFLAEKAAELGVAELLPVFTRHTDVRRVNTVRLRANVIEAAEQSERLSIPQIHEPVSFDAFLAAWPMERRLYFLDETGAGAPIADVLKASTPEPAGFLTGPEGGFAQSELDALRQLPFATPLGLGPRILRAETAALAAVVCWQALLGDWAAKT